MTQEEKIKEIIRLSNTNQVYGVADFDDLHESLHEDLMEMAKWKDDKFYMILACIKYSLEKSNIDKVDEFINNIKKEWEE